MRSSVVAFGASAAALVVAGACTGVAFSLWSTSPGVPLGARSDEVHVVLSSRAPEAESLLGLAPATRRVARALLPASEAAYALATHPAQRAARATSVTVWARRHGGGHSVLHAQACDRSLFSIFGRRLVQGEVWSRHDEVALAPVAVLSRRAALELAGTPEATGLEVEIEGRRFRVAGVLGQPNDAELLYDPLAMTREQSVYLPHTLARSLSLSPTLSIEHAPDHVADTLVFVERPGRAPPDLETIRAWAPDRLRFTTLDGLLFAVSLVVALSLGVACLRLLRADALARADDLFVLRTVGATRRDLARQIARPALALGLAAVPFAVLLATMLRALVEALAPFPAALPALGIGGPLTSALTCLCIAAGSACMCAAATAPAARSGARARGASTENLRDAPWSLLSIEVALLVAASQTLLGTYEPMRAAPLGRAGASGVVAARGAPRDLRAIEPDAARVVGPPVGASSLARVALDERGAGRWVETLHADESFARFRQFVFVEGQAPRRSGDVAISTSLASALVGVGLGHRLDLGRDRLRLVGIFHNETDLAWRTFAEAGGSERWALTASDAAAAELAERAEADQVFSTVLGEWIPIGLWRHGWVLLLPIALFLIAHALGVAGLVEQDIQARRIDLAVRVVLGATPRAVAWRLVARSVRASMLGAVGGVALGQLLIWLGMAAGALVEPRAWHVPVVLGLFFAVSAIASWRTPRRFASVAVARST